MTALQAGSVGQLSSWQRHIDRATVKRMIDVLRQFGLNFYGMDPEPDYGWLPADLRSGGQRRPVNDSR